MRIRLSRGSRRPAAIALVLAGVLAGCSSMSSVEDVFHADRDVAQVRLGDETVEVASGHDDDSRAAVRDMRVENWADAAVLLERAASRNPDDWQTAFALGVAYEKLGRPADALRSYESANRLLKGAGKADVTAAVLRLKSAAPAAK